MFTIVRSVRHSAPIVTTWKGKDYRRTNWYKAILARSEAFKSVVIKNENGNIVETVV